MAHFHSLCKPSFVILSSFPFVTGLLVNKSCSSLNNFFLSVVFSSLIWIILSRASPFTSTFGSNQTNTSGSAGFSFGFLNKNDSKTETSTEKDDDDAGDEEHSSPKKEVEPVVEEGAVYSKKCKLYYKKDDAYVERGLGNIHLKMTEEKKLQLIIRAGTSLGNILLNIIMTSTTPLERLGKNNVMLVTVPNPPLEKQDETNPAPVTFLIRVKTAEEADELKEKITNLTN